MLLSLEYGSLVPDCCTVVAIKLINKQSEEISVSEDGEFKKQDADDPVVDGNGGIEGATGN